MKRGLAMAFPKFNAYALAKWDQPKGVRLRDVLFLSHAKPKDEAQATLWKQLIDGTLPAADTWEVALSGGADKKTTWERLIAEKRLGYMALLMNLRNMAEANVDERVVTAALLAGAPFSKAFPFRYVASAKAAPQYADALNTALLSQKRGNLGGRTAVVVDVSGSMVGAPISERSKMDRLDAAAALAMYLRESCESVRVFGFTDQVVEVQNVRGLGLHAALRSIPNGGTLLGQCLEIIKGVVPDYDRIVVVTDEQANGMGDARSNPLIKAWTKYAYLINVAPYAPGLDTSGGWTRVNGWSDRIVDWISYEETGRIVGEDE
jgi:60 kDa SS-A/Ro ribonucleoprotein